MKKFLHNNVLIVRLSSMGDVILISAAIRCVRNQFPDARIDVLTSKPFKELLQYNPRINNVLEYDKSKSISENNSHLKKIILINDILKYDILIDLQNNIRTFFHRKALGLKIIKFTKNRLYKKLLVDFKIKLKNRNRIVPKAYIDTAYSLGVKDDGEGLEIWLPDENEADVYLPNKKSYSPNLSKIAIAPGAKHNTKRWPAEFYISLCDMLSEKYKAKFVLVGGAEDKELCENIANKTKFKCENLAGKLSILETTKLIDSCDLAITNDSGVMHIAVARKTPVAAFFGSTTTDLGFGPFRSPALVLETELNCRPCTHIGRSSCPKGHFKCMKNISPNIAFESICSFVNQFK